MTEITAPSQEGVDTPGGYFAILVSVELKQSFEPAAACAAAPIAVGGLFSFLLRAFPSLTMEPIAPLEPLAPSISGSQLHCVWCESEVGSGQGDHVQFEFFEGSEPDTMETDEGAKVSIPCPECGKDNVFLGSIMGE